MVVAFARLLGSGAVDYPRVCRLYRNATGCQQISATFYWGTLDDTPERAAERQNVKQSIEKLKYDAGKDRLR